MQVLSASNNDLEENKVNIITIIRNNERLMIFEWGELNYYFRSPPQVFFSFLMLP